MRKSSEQQTSASADGVMSHLARRSILIVDDNHATAKGLAVLFRQAGYEVATFHEGLAALKAAERHKADAAIVDVHLPDISGLVLSQRLRETLGPGVPIVVLSGDSSMEVLNSLSHVGATYFFQKPVSGAMLLEHFKGVLADPTRAAG